jgi:hypothetical protein
MIIKTGIVITNLKGEPIKNEDVEIMLGEVLSNILLADKSGGKMKMFVLAEKLFKAKNQIELDKADFALIKTSVEKTEIYGNLINGQALLILEAIKDKDLPKEEKKV